MLTTPDTSRATGTDPVDQLIEPLLDVSADSQDRPRASDPGARKWPSGIAGAPDWFIGLAICLALGIALLGSALIGPLVFLPVYVLTLPALAVVLWRCRRRPAVVVTALLTWFAIHKLLVAALAPSIGSQETVWLQNYKELMYLLLFAIGCLSVLRSLRGMSAPGSLRRLSMADWLAVMFLGLVTAYFVAKLVIAPTTGGSPQSALIYARRFASLPIIFLAGRFLLGDRHDLRRAIAYLVVVAVVVAAFGLIERLVLGDGFWTNVINVGQFQQYGVQEGFASSRARLVDGLPATWLSTMDTVTIRRLVATFLEPTTLALFLAFAFGLTAFTMPEWRRANAKRWLVALAVIGGALVLTIGKGGYTAIAVISIVVLARTSRRSALAVAGVVGLFGLVALAVAQVLPVASNVERHLAGLISGVSLSMEQPLGAGLGSTGFWGTQGKVGTDSTLGAVASQLGWLATALYYGWLGATAWQLLPSRRETETWDLVRRTIAASIIALLVVSVVSNSASGLLAGSFYVIFAGWALSANEARQTGIMTARS